MRLAAPIASALLAAALLVGCGGSSHPGSTGSTQAPPATSAAPAGASAQSCPTDGSGVEGLRATGVSCGTAQQVVLTWLHSAPCAPAGVSRAGCGAAGYRCVATATDRGYAVSCSGPGRSIAFVAKRQPSA